MADIANPILAQAYAHDWYYPWSVPEEVLESPTYQRAVEQGWAEWIETPLDFEAVENGYVYDVSLDVDGMPAYWFEGRWLLHDGTEVTVEDEQSHIGHVGRGDHFMRFCETFLRHTKNNACNSELVGKPYRFLPWMRKLVATLFGWVHADSRLRRFQELYVAIAKKGGKALSDDTPVPTPGGWKNHGDLRVGDRLFDRHGNQCEVIQVHPKCNIDRVVKFSNGEEIKCSKEHLWVTESLNHHKQKFDSGEEPVFEHGCLYCGGKVYAKRLCDKHYRRNMLYGSPTLSNKPARGKCTKKDGYYPLSEKSTSDIADSLRTAQAFNHRVPMHSGIVCDEVELPADPWVLGYWLGDGDKQGTRISVGHKDESVLCKMLEDVGYKVAYRSESPGKIALSVDTKDGVYGRGTNNFFRKQLVSLNLLHNKHVPKEYLRASRSQRLALLQGLMDSDGTICERGHISISQKNPVVVDGVCKLLASLGIKYSCMFRKKTCINAPGGPKECDAYHIHFHAFKDEHPVFRMPRKLARMRSRADLQMRTGRSRYVQIQAVEEITPVQGNCITVSSPDGTYLCGETMIPTHNSALMSVIALYMLMADGTPKAQVYSCACDRNQARIIYDEAAHMVKGSSTIEDYVTVVDSRARLVHQQSGSFYVVLSADAHRNDGVDSSCTLVDEIHRHPNRKLYAVMQRAGLARSEPLLAVITTYGPSLSDGSIWAEIHTEAKQQLEGNRPDSWRNLVFVASAEPIPITAMATVPVDSTRISVGRLQQPVDASTIIFDASQLGDIDGEENKIEVTITEPAKRFQDYLVVAPTTKEIPIFSEATANLDWRSDHAIRRANPSVDVVTPLERIRKDIDESRTPEREAETRQLSLNIVSGSGRKWLSQAAWTACGKMQVQPQKLIGRPCYAGLDISFGNDLIGLSLAFPNWEMGTQFEMADKPRINLLTWAWTPDAMIEEREEKEQFPYRHYARQPYLFDNLGPIRFCQGNVIDFGQVASEILDIFRMFEIAAVAYDPNYASFIVPKLEEDGIVCVAHRQGSVSMSPPCKRFAEGVYRGWIAHGNNAVLDRAVEGAQLHPPDKAGNTYLSKGKSHTRIDPLVAAVMAVGFATSPPILIDGAYSDQSTGMWG